jgi:hypothetical protein
MTKSDPDKFVKAKEFADTYNAAQSGENVAWREPTKDEFMAALAAFHEVEDELDVDWTALNPIQGEATPKVFAYRMAKAVIAAGDSEGQAETGRRYLERATAPLVLTEEDERTLAALLLRTADATTDRYRQTCSDCGRRRLCRDWVWMGVPGVGVSLCRDCEAARYSEGDNG